MTITSDDLQGKRRERLVDILRDVSDAADDLRRALTSDEPIKVSDALHKLRDAGWDADSFIER